MIKYVIMICTIILAVTDASFAAESPLPDPLTSSAGEKITNAEQWQKMRRPEILELFRTHVYGRAPIDRPDDLRFEVKEINKNALGGAATFKHINIHFSGAGGKGQIELLLFIPNKVSKPAPGFLLICNRDKRTLIQRGRRKVRFGRLSASLSAVMSPQPFIIPISIQMNMMVSRTGCMGYSTLRIPSDRLMHGERLLPGRGVQAG